MPKLKVLRVTSGRVKNGKFCPSKPNPSIRKLKKEYKKGRGKEDLFNAIFGEEGEKLSAREQDEHIRYLRKKRRKR